MLLLTYPTIVVTTDNRLIATNICFHTGVTTLGWTAAIWCAGGALINLSDWIETMAWTSRNRGRRWEASGLQRALCSNWTGHAAGQQGRKEGEDVNNVKVHIG